MFMSSVPDICHHRVPPTAWSLSSAFQAKVAPAVCGSSTNLGATAVLIFSKLFFVFLKKIWLTYNNKFHLRYHYQKKKENKT